MTAHGIGPGSSATRSVHPQRTGRTWRPAGMPSDQNRIHPIITALEVARKARELSPETAGRMAGVSGRTIRQWESSGRTPQLVELTAYAWVLGLRLTLEDR